MGIVTFLLSEALSKAYDPSQARDDHGRWTSGGQLKDHVEQALRSGESKQFKQTYQNLQKQRKSLSSAQKKAVNDYTSPAYQKLNRDLREGKSPNEVRLIPEGSAGTVRSGADLVKNLDSAIASSEIPENLVLYRGTNLNASSFKIGATVSDRGYTSTSMKAQSATKFGYDKAGVLLAIHAPKGTPGISAGLPNEYEILLPRNMKFQVQSINQRICSCGSRFFSNNESNRVGD